MLEGCAANAVTLKNGRHAAIISVVDHGSTFSRTKELLYSISVKIFIRLSSEDLNSLNKEIVI